MASDFLTTMRDVELRQDRFEIIKDRFQREYKNWGFRQAYMQIGDFTRQLVDEKRFVTAQYAEVLPSISLEDVKNFSKQMISQCHVELLVHGNVYREEAKKWSQLIESTLTSRPLPPSEWAVRRNMLLPEGSNFVYNRKHDDPENINHAIEYYLQVGDSMDYDVRAKVQLLAQMTDEPSFDQLRTKEQLGYVVWSGARPSATTLGYRVLIQSERTPEYLESRIEAFLAKYKQDLADMSQEDFDKHKQSVIARKLEKMKNLTSETTRLWNYVMGEAYNFFQIDVDVEHLRKLTKKDMQDFYAKYIDPESPTRAKLSTYLNAQKVVQEEALDVKPAAEEAVAELPAPKTSKSVVVEDVEAWKSGLQVSRGIKPVTDIRDFQDFESKL